MQILRAERFRVLDASFRYFEGLLARGALAHIVAGFAHRRPDLIELGANLLMHPSNVRLIWLAYPTSSIAESQQL